MFTSVGIGWKGILLLLLLLTTWILIPSSCEPDSNHETNNNNHDDDDDRDDEEKARREYWELWELCRRNPTWRIPSNNDKNDEYMDHSNMCSDLMDFPRPPRDIYWRNRTSHRPFTPYILTPEMDSNMIECMDEAMAKRLLLSEMGLSIGGDNAGLGLDDSGRTVLSPVLQPHVVSMHTHTSDDSGGVDSHDVNVVEIAHALSEEEAFAVKALASCTRKYIPRKFKRRAFEASYGGNDCTFLATLLQAYIPGVAAQVYNVARLAWDAARWYQPPPPPPPRSESYPPRYQFHEEEEEEDDEYDDDEYDNDDEYEEEYEYEYEDNEYDPSHNPNNHHHPPPPPHHHHHQSSPRPDPKSLGIHTTEHLSYRVFQEGLGQHEDGGSIYTILIALSDPHHYGGGEFYLPSNRRNGGGDLLIKPTRLSSIVFLSQTTHAVKPITFGWRESFATELWLYDDVPLGHERPGSDWMEAFLNMIQSKKRNNNNKDNEDDDEDDDDWMMMEEMEDLFRYGPDRPGGGGGGGSSSSSEDNPYMESSLYDTPFQGSKQRIKTRKKHSSGVSEEL